MIIKLGAESDNSSAVVTGTADGAINVNVVSGGGGGGGSYDASATIAQVLANNIKGVGKYNVYVHTDGRLDYINAYYKNGYTFSYMLRIQISYHTVNLNQVICIQTDLGNSIPQNLKDLNGWYNA